MGQIKRKFFFEENVIPDSKIPKSDDFKDFLDKAEMNIYLGIKDEIKILIIILYYFYLGIKHNVYSKLFKKQEEIKNFSLDKIKKEIEDVIQNKNCESIRFYNFICYDFPEIDYRILKLNKYKIFFLNIEQLLQISILYYQYYL